MKALFGKDVTLWDGELLAKEACNRSYLDELKSPALLQNFYQEAGINQNFGSKHMAHTGWEDPSCQLRGHFLGHYLSACAVRYFETGDEELLAKANHIVHELKRCQIENGGLWAASIPEKYFYWIARGKQVWAPHYNVHKTFMGLCDTFRYTGNQEALDVAVSFAKWFYDFTNEKTREEMDNILDFETGGMLEVWADLYEFTKDNMFLELIERYDRHRLFDKLLEGIDVLTNMHANTTIPEAIGAARVYEVTGNERYKNIALKYWEMAVTKRGSFVTGGQTCGEIWTPLKSMAERLGDKNQEHCTVYNMIRLADILFKWTGKVEFLDYIEQNLYNGIMAQGYFRGGHANGQTAEFPEEGLITYFLPMSAGLRKGWGQKFSDFFCCHGTLVQANAAHNRYLYYQDGDQIYVGVYAASKATFEVNGTSVTLQQRRDTLSGSFHSSSTSSALQAVGENTHIYPHQPDVMKQCFKVSMEKDAEFTLCLRLPKWLKRKPELTINGEITDTTALEKDGFINLRRTFKNDDEICIWLPLDLYATKLEGSDNYYAFSYGPIALAGLSDAERTLHLKGHELTELLTHDNEREWGSWKDTFKTRFQDVGIKFIPLKNIGYERYQIYFPVEE
ncbi:MAG: glycoside hydrolase family 127 protein [Lachnospiraceae bacterium]|nr:glycoside hydrolase family 127 protein [Lachnospiraceae bacterium]